MYSTRRKLGERELARSALPPRPRGFASLLAGGARGPHPGGKNDALPLGRGLNLPSGANLLNPTLFTVFNSVVPGAT